MCDVNQPTRRQRGSVQLCAACASDPALLYFLWRCQVTLRLFTISPGFSSSAQRLAEGCGETRPLGTPRACAGSCRACRRAPLSPPEGKPRGTGGREKSEPVPVRTARFAPTLPRWQSSRAAVCRVGGNLASLFVHSPTPETTAQVRRDTCKLWLASNVC